MPDLVSTGLTEQLQTPLSVVYFNSYHQGFKWSDDEQKGIEDALKKIDPKRPIHFYVEYMDTRRIVNEAYLKQLPQFYKEKYRGINIDLILSADDSAFNFLLQYRQDIFPDIPYVFCGVNYFEPKQLNAQRRITGVNETASFKETLSLIFDLHPQTEKVLIINDQTITGFKVREPLLKETGLLGNRAQFEFTDNLTFYEIQEKVRNLDQRTVILFTFFFRDAANQFFENSEVISQLKSISRVPIYGAWDFNLGLGILGGMLTSGYFQGQKAGEMAINILSGADIDTMPVVMESPNRYFFDYNLMEQHGISMSKLPKDSIIINFPETIYDIYSKYQTVVLISAAIFLSTIVGILLLGGLKLRRANRKLTLSETKYRSIFENTGTAMMMINKDTIISMVNSEFEILSGYLREEVELKKSWQEFVNQTDREKMLVYHNQRREKQKDIPSNYEFRFVKKDKKERHVFISVGMIQGTDYSVASMLDITEQKQAENEKTKLEVVNRQLQKTESLSRMAGAIAHHFNNQLGIVIGNLEMAIEDLPQAAAPDESLTAAMQGALKAAEISGLMLIYLGQTTGMHVHLDLSDTCRQSLPLLQVTLPKGLSINIDLPNVGPIIRANANQIQQVLANLLTNAWEAIDNNKQGAIGLTVKTVSQTDIPTIHRFPVDWQPQVLTYACLEIWDTGCGISEEDTDNLFDPFFSTKFTGRGLGLPVVLGIVKAHSGVITVESQTGQGTTFQVFFPVSVEEDPIIQSIALQSLSVKTSGTVLVVEDEVMMREMAASMLTRMGYKVLVANDGIEALEVFENYLDEILVVVSDLSMPRMDGWETLTALRRIRPDIPVVLASGHDESKVLAGDHPELPQVFLHKPYQKSDLQAAIDRAIGGLS